MLTHSFVSSKPDGVDTSKIRKSNWNDDHVWTGGNSGSLLVRDTTVPTYGASWVQSVAAGAVLASAGAGALPVWTTTPRVSQLGVGADVATPGSNGPTLLLRTYAGQGGASDRNSPLVIQAPNDYPTGGDKVNFFVSSGGDLYLNTAIFIAGHKPWVGTIDGSGNFTVNGILDPNPGVFAMISMQADVAGPGIAVNPGISGGWCFSALDTSQNFLFSVEGDGSLRWGTTTHTAMDTKLSRASKGYLLVQNTVDAVAPALLVGNSLTDAVMLQYSAGAVVLRTISGNNQAGTVDLWTIQPSGGADFILKQNGVAAFESISSGAVVNTLVLQAGRVGVGAAPPSGCNFYVGDAGSSMTLRVGNNSFGNDFVVFNQDASLTSTKYFLAGSQAGSGITILNCQSGGTVDLRIANSSIFKVTSTVATLATGVLPTSDPHVAGQLWRSGTALQVSIG